MAKAITPVAVTKVIQNNLKPIVTLTTHYPELVVLNGRLAIDEQFTNRGVIV